jgi:seryl-tRNA synthetase
MIDIELLRKNPSILAKLIEIGRADSSKVNPERFFELDERRRELIKKIDDLRAGLNEINKGLQGKPDEATLQEIRKKKEESSALEAELKNVEAEWQTILDWIPNIPFDEVPGGKSSADNVETKAWIPEAGYLDESKLGKENHSGQYMPDYAVNSDTKLTPKPHWEIGTALDIIDLEAGPKVSGSRFYYLRKEGALIVMGIFNLLMRKLLSEGFDPMIVPILVREKALYGSSHFPGDADQVYKLESKYIEDENALYLTGSSEPSNFAYFMDRILSADELPTKVMAITPCFRSEVGSWGKDVRGIKRTHQFDKLEMNMIIEADDTIARETQEYLLSLNEWLLQELRLPYHVINMSIGDLGYYAAAKKYDIEVWLPSEKSYMEVMSNSITTDYQSRRLNIKYKDKEGKSKFVYTLNDTGATHRLLIAIIEHYQLPDGSIKIPDVLREFVGKDTITKKK